MSDDLKEKSIRQILIEKDEVSLVETDGKFIAPKDKYEAHKYPSKLHLAISVWLFNSRGEVLLQKRSEKKIVGANWWANTACGNVWPTETFFDCANRRLDKELGIKGVLLKPKFKFTYKAYGNDTYGEHEIDQVYVGFLNSKIKPNPEEVNETKWVDFKELYNIFSTLEYVHPDQTLPLSKIELKQKTPPVKINIGGEEIVLAPWTAMMLKDIRLFDAFKELFA